MPQIGNLGVAAIAILLLTTSASAQTVAPQPPSRVLAAVLGATVTLAWSAPSLGEVPTGYFIDAAVSPGGPIIASLAIASTSVAMPNVPDGTYYVRVFAVNAAGRSASSEEVTVSRLAATDVATACGQTAVVADIDGNVGAITFDPGTSLPARATLKLRNGGRSSKGVSPWVTFSTTQTSSM